MVRAAQARRLRPRPVGGQRQERRETGERFLPEAELAREHLQAQHAVQGNLDPVLLLAGGSAMATAARAIVAALRGGPFVFNLGHGILPETPIANVERMLARVRAGRP